MSLAALAVLAAAPGSASAQAPPSTSAVADTIRLAPETPVESLLAAPLTAVGERWSLARCIQTALERNADIRIARARARQASGAALSAWRGLIPTVTTEASYTQVRPDEFSAFRGVVIDTFRYTALAERQEFGSLSATATSNIWSAPAIGEKRRLDHLKSGSEYDERETRNQVVYRVKQQYFDLLKAELLAQVARETERLARDEEARADARLQVGAVARGDLLKARARRATTEADRIRAENQVQIQAARLRQLIGVNPGQPILAEPTLDDAIVIPDSSESVRQALISRPRLESAKAVERAARSGLFGARAVRLPRIDSQIAVDRTKIDERIVDLISDTPGAPVPPDELETSRYATQWRGSVRATLPLFEGLAIEGNIRQAKSTLLEAEAQRRQRELDVAVEVQQAWLSLREAVQRIGVAREGLASADEDYNFSKGRYELGAGTFLDLLTAEVGLANARQRLVEAIADARVAEAGLELAVGAKRY